MKAVRAIIWRLAAHIQDRPHVLPALAIIDEVAELARYLRVATSGDTVLEFEPGRELREVRTVLATMPADQAGERLGVALRILHDAVQKDSNKTVVYADQTVRNVFQAVADSHDAYLAAKDDAARLRIMTNTADAIRLQSGTLPHTGFVEEALQVIARRRGRPKGGDEVVTLTIKGVAVTKPKKVVLEQLLQSIGHDVADVYAYLPRPLSREEAKKT